MGGPIEKNIAHKLSIRTLNRPPLPLPRAQTHSHMMIIPLFPVSLNHREEKKHNSAHSDASCPLSFSLILPFFSFPAHITRDIVTEPELIGLSETTP